VFQFQENLVLVGHSGRAPHFSHNLSSEIQGSRSFPSRLRFAPHPHASSSSSSLTASGAQYSGICSLSTFFFSFFFFSKVYIISFFGLTNFY